MFYFYQILQYASNVLNYRLTIWDNIIRSHQEVSCKLYRPLNYIETSINDNNNNDKDFI